MPPTVTWRRRYKSKIHLSKQRTYSISDGVSSVPLYFMSEVYFKVYELIQPRCSFWWLWEKLLTSPPILLNMCTHISGYEIVCIVFLKSSVLLLSGSCLSCWWSHSLIINNSFHKCCTVGNSHLTSWLLVEKVIPHVDGNCEIVQERKIGTWSSGFSAASGRRWWEQRSCRSVDLENNKRRQKTGQHKCIGNRHQRPDLLSCFLACGPSESGLIRWPIFFWDLEEWLSTIEPSRWSLSYLQPKLCLKPRRWEYVQGWGIFIFRDITGLSLYGFTVSWRGTNMMTFFCNTETK